MINLLEDEIKAIIEAEGEEETSTDTQPAVDMTPPESPETGLKMVLDVNKNPTKKGIKVQFIVPQGTDEAKKEEINQKLVDIEKNSIQKFEVAIALSTVEFDTHAKISVKVEYFSKAKYLAPFLNYRLKKRLDNYKI